MGRGMQRHVAHAMTRARLLEAIVTMDTVPMVTFGGAHRQRCFNASRTGAKLRR